MAMNVDFQPLPRKPANFIPIWLCAVCAILYAMSWHLSLSFGDLVSGIGDTGDYISQFFHPDFSLGHKYVWLMIETVCTALWGTAIACIVALVLSPLAASTLTPHPLIYRATREVLNFMRAMPDMLLALMLVSAIGLGPLPGAFALGIHTAGFLGKFYSELLERVPRGRYEALAATGAGFVQTTMIAGYPSILREMAGYTFYIFDRNIRMASVLGLVGAGGIGLELESTLGFFLYNKASAIIIIIFATLFVVDALSSTIRRRLT
ncbi:MAG: phosphonate ABC transporter, permease protein PhnE [Rhodospirillales bacterium]|nr:phosphonate ABC transporter, permease protein PhnE [Rhodospirillales bacterium]